MAASDSAALAPPVTPPAVAPSVYRPEIDGLRAVAVLAVIVNHLHRPAMPSGYLGVDIFFVISGFVITTSLLRRTGPVEGGGLGTLLLGFYLRRIKRLVPALVVCVVVTALLLCVVNPEPGPSLETGIWSLFGLSNLHLHHAATDYFGLSAELNAFTQTWSLGVEEQFYFAFPTLFWFTGAGRAGRPGERRLAWILALLSLASLLTFVAQSRSDPSAAYFLLPARFWEIGAGALLCLWLRWRESRPGPPLAALPPLPVAGVLLLALFLPRDAWVPATVAVVVGTVLLITTLRPGSAARALFRHPALVSIGLISYSLYLWHWSVIVLSRWTIGLHAWTLPLQGVAMLLLAWGSFRWIEQPLRAAPWSPRRWLALVYGLLALVLAALPLRALAGFSPTALYAGNREAFRRTSFDLATAVGGTTISENTCEHWTPSTLRDCVVPPTRPGAATILLLGDSHAQHLYPLMGELRRRRGVGLASFAPGGFSFPLLYWQDPAADRSREAARFFRTQAARLQPGDILLLSSRLEALLDPSTTSPASAGPGRSPGSAGGGVAGKPADPGVERWGKEVVRLARELRHRGVEVVVVLPVPSFHGSDLSRGITLLPPSACLPEWFRPHPDPACVGALRRDRGEARLVSERVIRPLRPLLEKEANIHLFDPFDHFCAPSAKDCATTLDGVTRFRDDNHLSLDGSLSLEEEFLAFLDRNGLGKRRSETAPGPPHRP